MPFSTPNLQRLRRRSRIKPGQFAEFVGASRSHYSNVEYGRKVGSPELFEQCAAVLSKALGENVDAVRDLIAQDDQDDTAQERRREHVSPEPLDPTSRPPHEPRRPPTKPPQRGAA